MNLTLEPGKYIVAVSGGVDSMSLLHALRARPQVELVVAHFDHGIRPDSADDRRLVQHTAETYGLPFVYAEGHLGPQSSEATARAARYEFLERVRNEHGAQAIITAHHQDDVLETAILNVLRGTGRKGLTSLTSRPGFERPLLNVSKQDILAYAKRNNLQWHEDSTNAQPHYLRNYVRLQIVPRFTAEQKQQFIDILERAHDTNQALDRSLAALLPTQSSVIDRRQFIMLPHAVAKETLASWLRSNRLREFDRSGLERLVVAAKTGQPGSSVNIYGSARLSITRETLVLTGVTGLASDVGTRYTS